jgi:hypothetical protein
MSNPTDPDSPAEPWRLTLTEGDLLEVRPAPAPGTAPQVVLTLPPWRATDLSATLDRYNRIAAIFAESSDIMTEESLARALGDARAAATGRSDGVRAASKVGPAERGRAMVVLQRARPELSHDKLVAIVDAVSWWLDNQQDYKATDLLQALVPDEVSGEVYLTLLDWKPPAEPPQRPNE